MVYNRASGGTHLLDAFSATVLRAIAERPCSFERLACELAERSGAEDEEVRARLGAVLKKLDRLGLIERMAPCGSAI